MYAATRGMVLEYSLYLWQTLRAIFAETCKLHGDILRKKRKAIKRLRFEMINYKICLF